MKIYFSTYDQEIAKKINRTLSFDIRNSKKHFSLLYNTDDCELKTFDSNYYKIIRQIGKGSYGKIYLVQDPKTKEKFALKKIIIGDALELKENQNEFKLTWKLTKLNPELKIVKKYAIETKKLDKYNLVMYILMEVANCDWEQELINRQKDNAFYSEIELIEILKSLVNTLAELQKKGISHRDVKPQNILCFGKDGYKLSDFGEAKTKKRNYIKSNNNYDDNTRIQTIRGTELYMSPILFKALQMNSVDGAQYNAYKSDVFSLGMCFLLASCLNYQSLYDIREVYNMDVLKEIVEKNLKNYSNNYINLILNMLQINEKLRPDFIELNSMII
jgi:serine/threonine protein kinase